MRLRHPQLHDICGQRRPGSRGLSRHSSNLGGFSTGCVSKRNFYVACWRRPGLGVLGSALLALLSLVLAPANMEAFLRPASAYPPLLQALQRGPLRVSYACLQQLGSAMLSHFSGDLCGIGREGMCPPAMHTLPSLRFAQGPWSLMKLMPLCTAHIASGVLFCWALVKFLRDRSTAHSCYISSCFRQY